MKRLLLEVCYSKFEVLILQTSKLKPQISSLNYLCASAFICDFKLNFSVCSVPSVVHFVWNFALVADGHIKNSCAKGSN